MRYLASLLSVALFAACGTAGTDYGGTNGARADELPLEEVPVLAESYGFVVSSVLETCSTEANVCECRNEDRKNLTTTIRGVATMTQDGAAVEVSFAGCRMDVEWKGDDYNVGEYLNERDTIRHLGEIAHISGVFVAGEEGPVLQSGLSALVLGAKLSDPVGEDMPTSKRDERSLDQDNDSKSGVSLEAPIGRVFLGLRVIFDMPLTLSPGEDGNLSGTLEAVGFDVSVYDDSIPFVNARKKVNKALTKIMMVSQYHQVTMLPGLSDCDQVLAEM
ncbi:MAG: hypothetical protein GY811_21765 [Myxococcales bacterium]|nr:hypothetical protein [Myxococcales bacterium]